MALKWDLLWKFHYDEIKTQDHGHYCFKSIFIIMTMQLKPGKKVSGPSHVQASRTVCDKHESIIQELLY